MGRVLWSVPCRKSDERIEWFFPALKSVNLEQDVLGSQPADDLSVGEGAVQVSLHVPEPASHAGRCCVLYLTVALKRIWAHCPPVLANGSVNAGSLARTSPLSRSSS